MPWSSLVSLEVLVETAEVVMATLFWKGGDTTWWKRGTIYLIDGTTAQTSKSGGFSKYFSCENIKMLLLPFEQKRVGCSNSPAFRTAKKTRNLLDASICCFWTETQLYLQESMSCFGETSCDLILKPNPQDRSTVLKVILELHSPWKWMFGRRLFSFWDSLFSGTYPPVSFREG